MITSMRDALARLRDGYSMRDYDGRWYLEKDAADFEVAPHVAVKLEDRGYLVVLSTARTLALSEWAKDAPSGATRRRFGMMTL